MTLVAIAAVLLSAAAPQDFARDVDAALERVRQVGLGGLTPAERQVLQRAVERRQRQDGTGG